MARVADQDQNTPLRRVAFALAMDLGDERTGRIQNAQSIFLRFILDLPCDPVRTENGDRPGGHFRQVLDETRALRAQGLDDMAVVHDFMPDIDRRAKLCQRLLDDVNGPDDAGAEPARLRKHHLHGRCSFSREAKELIDCISRAAASAAGDRPSKQ